MRLSWKAMILIRVLVLFFLFSIGICNEGFNSHLLPRPLILEYPETGERNLGKFDEEILLQCTSWRFAAEANNLSPWKTIPEECAEYVKDYMMGRGYKVDLERVSNEAGVYAKSLQLSEDGKDAWVFDVDETLLSNLPYYAEHKFGLELFDHLEFAIFSVEREEDEDDSPNRLDIVVFNGDLSGLVRGSDFGDGEDEVAI